MKRSADMKETVNYSNSALDIGNVKDYDAFIKSLQICLLK